MSGRLPLFSRLAASAAALLCWTTIWVPISSTRPDAVIEVESRLLDFQSNNALGIVWAATGLVTLMAAIAWLPRATRWWPLPALATVVVQIVNAILHAMPTGIFWDGQDEFGRPTGGYEEIVPALGWWLLVLATASMLLAAVPPLLARTRSRRVADAGR